MKLEVIATGLRAPYLGIHPIKGTLTATDQQGNFVPSTPIYLIKKGDYTGAEIDRQVNQAKDYFVTTMVSTAIFGYLIIGAMVSAIASAFLAERKFR